MPTRLSLNTNAGLMAVMGAAIQTKTLDAATRVKIDQVLKT